jgi:hypothetical protein
VWSARVSTFDAAGELVKLLEVDAQFGLKVGRKLVRAA